MTGEGGWIRGRLGLKKREKKMANLGEGGGAWAWAKIDKTHLFIS